MRDVKAYISRAKSRINEEEDLEISEAMDIKRTVIEMDKGRQDPIGWIYYGFLFGFECGYQARRGEK